MPCLQKASRGGDERQRGGMRRLVQMSSSKSSGSFNPVGLLYFTISLRVVYLQISNQACACGTEWTDDSQTTHPPPTRGKADVDDSLTESRK